MSTTTLVGLCVGAAFLACLLAVTWWLCHRRREHTKLSSDKTLAFRPPRRKTTAVKSPGSVTHYLKKSPSPTGPAKSPPGSAAQTPSPTSSQQSNGSSQARTPQQAGTPVQIASGDFYKTIRFFIIRINGFIIIDYVAQARSPLTLKMSVTRPSWRTARSWREVAAAAALPTKARMHLVT